MNTVAQIRIGAFATLLLICPGCEREPPRQRVPLTAEPNATSLFATNGKPGVLRVGVASVLSPRDTLRHYRELIDYLGQELGLPAEMVQRSSYVEMNALVRDGNCTAAFVCNYAYVQAHQEFGASMLVSPVVNGRAIYHAYLIVRSDSPVESLAGLAGKQFAYADPNCNAGRLYPSYRLKQLGQNPRGFFAEEIPTGSYENAIYAVADGLADAAGVESPLYNFLLAQKHPAALKTRILETSPPFGTPPLIVHPGLDVQVQARLRKCFLMLHESEHGQEILARIHVDRFVEPDGKLYAPVFKMAEAVERR